MHLLLTTVSCISGIIFRFTSVPVLHCFRITYLFIEADVNLNMFIGLPRLAAQIWSFTWKEGCAVDWRNSYGPEASGKGIHLIGDTVG